MKTVLNTGMDWKLVAIEPLEQSPMPGHEFGEVAADAENKTFYIHETILVFNGAASVIKSCRQYPNLWITEEKQNEHN